jgi:hypothetical protein
MIYFLNSNDEVIVKTEDQNVEVENSSSKIEHDSNVPTGAKYDRQTDTFTFKPSPENAFKKINQYFIDKEGGLDAGLDRIELLLSGGLGKIIDRSIAQGNFEIAKNRIDKHNDLTAQEKQDIKDILDGK